MLVTNAMQTAISDIWDNKTSLGIELGSTRIKAVLIGSDFTPIASGSHEWENQLEDGVWTYSLDAIWTGVRDCYAKLREDVAKKYALKLSSVGSMGVSGMMHGYMAFDKAGNLLVPFRTWRNTSTAEASEELVKLFNYPIPHRWSIAHLYQAILNAEQHVPQISHITTLAGYIHSQLTDTNVIGVGEASGMFPIDISTGQFNKTMIGQFNDLINDKSYSWKIEDILPDVATAGAAAGRLTAKGAKMLDPTGELLDGVPFCPPEGDAGTGMVATNSVARRSGNVSAGTSVFLMAVTEKDLKKVHGEIDLVTTPAGDLTAMVHANNCTGDLDAWINIFAEAVKSLGFDVSKQQLYYTLYHKALEADGNCGDLLSYNYISGESMVSLDEGRPLFMRKPDSEFSLANFMRTHLYSALGALKIGYDILEKEEGIEIDEIYGHGGFFKTEQVGQRIMAAALKAPVSVMETAGEGGPWGMALLAAYMKRKEPDESLKDYLANRVFSGLSRLVATPDKADVESFEAFMQRYKEGLDVERKAAGA